MVQLQLATRVHLFIKNTTCRTVGSRSKVAAQERRTSTIILRN